MKNEKNIIAVLPLCNFGGLAIFDVINGYDDKIISAFFDGEKYDKKAHSTIRYDKNGNCYFVRYGIKYYLDDFIKV